MQSVPAGVSERHTRLADNAESLLALSGALVGFIDARTAAIVDLGDAWRTLLGDRADALIGEGISMLFDQAEHAALAAALRSMRDGAPRASLDTRLTDASGATKTFTWHFAPASSPDLTLAVAREVTGTLAQDLQRQQAGARADALLAALPDLVFVIDREARIVDYHAPDLSALAHPPERFLGQRVFELMPPHVAALFEGDPLRPRTLEYSLVLPNDTRERHYHAVVAPFAGGDGAVVVVRDITPRVEAERAVRRAQQHLEEAQAMTRLGSWEFVPSTGEITWTDELFRIFGMERTGKGPSFEEYISRIDAVDRPTTLAAIERAVREGVPYDLWYRVTQPDGTQRHLQCHGEACRNADGVVERLRGTALDRTAERNVELELVRARKEALDASRSKSEFVAKVSHEIRTPLNGVIGMTALALDTALNPEQREFVAAAQTSALALLDIVNDILDLSKIEAGAIEFARVAFSPAEVATEVALALAPRADEKRVELVLALCPDLPQRLVGDPLRLKQVLMNLVGNSVKFTSAGDVAVDIGWLPERASLRAIVRDTGIGIAPERIGAIFEPFAQGDGTITARFGGTGLGLSIVRELVTRLGGRLDVESRQGVGSTFTVEIPFDASDASDAVGEAALPLRGVRALVLDDHPSVARAVATSLATRGGHTEVVDTVESALEALAARRFDVALVDAADECAPAAEYAARAPAAAPPWIALVSVSGRGRGVGATSLRKPVIERELVAAVSRALGRSASAKDPSEPPSEAPVAPAHVLVAEDNDVNGLVLRKLLERFGHTVAVVPSGRAALEAVARDRFDLVLMDVQMPDLDGLEATRAIRERERATGARLPIVALTASAMKGDEARCIEAGMDAYLSKPVLPDALRAVVNRTLRDAPR